MSESPSRPTQDILDKIDLAADQHDPLTFGNIMDILGQHSFAPILLLIGLIMMVPGPADIPGVPVVLGLIVIVVAGQLICHREHLWIPGWIERYEIAAERSHKMVSSMRKPAQWIDHFTKPRYRLLVNYAGTVVVGVACILIAMTTPILEFVPFSANLAGASIAAFAVALLAKDGLLASLAIGLSLATLGIVAMQLLGI
jgi:hypothetical protein